MNLSSFFYAFRTIFIPNGGSKDRGKIRGAIIGIVLSLIPILVVLQISSGIIEGITNRFLEIGTFHYQINSFSNSNKDDRDELIERIEALDFVNAAYPVIESDGLLYSKLQRAPIRFRGLPENIYSSDDAYREYLEIVDGSFDISENSYILVSKETAKLLSLEIGDKVNSLISVKLGSKTIFRRVDFVVKGIFSTGYFELDKFAVYINIDKAFSIFKNSGVSYIGVKVKDPFSDIVDNNYKLGRVAGIGWNCESWRDKNINLYNNFNSTLSMIRIIIVVIIIVSSFNIFSIMFMIQMEKRLDIAILKSLGVSPLKIFSSFLFVGVIIGVIGTVIGVSLGLLAAVNINGIINLLESFINTSIGFINFVIGNKDSAISIEIFNKDYYLDNIPLNLKVGNIFFITIFSIVFSSLASIIPAFIACRVKPLKTIRKF